jgi:hypothetical protein
MNISFFMGGILGFVIGSTVMFIILVFGVSSGAIRIPLRGKRDGIYAAYYKNEACDVIIANGIITVMLDGSEEPVVNPDMNEIIYIKPNKK